MSFHPPLYPVELPADTVADYRQLQDAYDALRQKFEQEVAAHRHLQSRYDELQLMLLHQQKLVSMVKELYGEQVLAATTDPITGLPNHRAVITRIEEEVSRCQSEHTSCAILFIDLDHFKRVNDTWGHRAGDSLLYEVARRLRSALRESDFVGRYGGEEFAGVITDVDASEAALIAERIRACVAFRPCTWEIEDTRTLVEIPITASIGVAVYQLHGVTRADLIECADRAMYQAKHSGRNRICFAEPELPSSKGLLPI
ncbi:MAG TPA: GGDEF domain-containing protein [Ktedonobacteraceae bacterium]|nr:GGDEF domain-containing protein [Ktedonobacteraceae bacterium]